MRKLLLVSILILTLTTPQHAFGSSNPPAEPASVTLNSIKAAGLSTDYWMSDPANPDVDRHMPDVAYNADLNESLVVWHRTLSSSYVIEGRLMTRNGPKGPAPVTLVINSVPVKQPAVVYSPTSDRYLLVYMKNTSGDQNTYEIWGKLLNPDLTTVKPDFEIKKINDRSLYTPRIAWNSKWNEFLVAFTAYSVSGGYPTDVADSILTAAGNVAWGAGISAVGFPHQVDVAYNQAADQYFAVWRVMGTGVSYSQVYGGRLDGNNGWLVGDPIHIHTSEQDQRYPRVASNSVNRYFVVWEEQNSFYLTWYVFGQEFLNDGSPVYDTHLVSNENTTLEEAIPSVAAWPGAATRFVVAYQVKTEQGIALQVAYNNNNENTFAIPGFFTLWQDSFTTSSYEFWKATNPEIAAAGPATAVFANEEDTDSDPMVKKHIYARYWSPNLAYLAGLWK